MPQLQWILLFIAEVEMPSGQFDIVGCISVAPALKANGSNGQAESPSERRAGQSRGSEATLFNSPSRLL
jgi:hypothetical protein